MSEMILPEGWVETELSMMADFVNGKAFKSTDWEDKGLPIIRIQNLNKPKANYNYTNKEVEDRYKVFKGDLLFAWSASIDCYIWKGGNAVLNQHIFNVKPFKQVEIKFFYYLLKKLVFSIHNHTHGTGMVHITKGNLLSLRVGLPSYYEQREMQNILDRYTNLIDQIQARLDAIPKIIEKFRQSVLNDAVSGRLTEEWRKVHETKPTNLNDITDFWTEKYIAETKKYKLPKFEPINESPPLPSNWQYTQIGKVFDVYVGATPSRKEDRYWEGDIPWVSSSEVAFCRIKDTKEKITKSGRDNSSTKLHPAGTVMLAMIGQGKTRGQAAILDIAACHNQNTAALRVPKQFVISDFLYFYLLKMYKETRMVGSGNNQKALNKSRVQSLEFHLPPMNEQAEIVKIVNQLFAHADQIEKSVAAAKARVDNLSQSILHQAFTGNLTQDWREKNPDLISGDNSAEALLAKIQAEKAEVAKQAKARKKSSKKSTAKKHTK